MTPLFPKDGTPITIIQGQTGDCYLLTALDCIMNSGDEGLQLVKSLFTETEDGVYLRIKRTEIYATSNNFNPDKMKDKYTHHYDPATNEDVFFMDKNRLKVIDEAWGGVDTNALALKIIERISSYYYTGEWPNENPLASIAAHNIPSRHSMSSTAFVGKFIGVEAHDTHNIDDMIKLKTINPAQPVYISMSYGRPDRYGVIHGRHALRIDKVIQKSNGSYDFVLINPHDNQKREIFSLEEIQKRNYRFSVYNTNTQNHELTQVLLKCSTQVGSYVFQNPKLHQLLISQHTRAPLNVNTVNDFFNVFRSIPYFESILDVMSPGDENKLLDCILLSQGDKNKFIFLLIQMIPSLELNSIIYTKGTDLDFKTLGSLIADKSSEPLVRERLKNPEFLSLVIEAACRDKSREVSCTMAEARNLIETGLTQYYFQGPDNSLSRCGGLRTLFIKQFFTREDIGLLFDSKHLLEKAVFTYIFMNGRVNEPLVDAVKQIDLNIIDNDFLNVLLQDLDKKNPGHLFNALFTLHAVNPALANALSTLVCARIEVLFNMPLKDFTESLYTEPNSDFHRWFFSTQEQMDESRAQSIIDEWILRITEFPVNFNSCNSVKAIDYQINQLNRQVDDLISLKSDLEEAVRAVGKEIGSHPELVQALEQKRNQIRDAGALKKEKLIADTHVIDTYINAIRNFSISFKDVTSEKDIDSHSRLLLAGLEGLIHHKTDLEAAKHSLGLLHPGVALLSEELEHKKREIKRLGHEHYHYFASAKAVIAKQVQQVNSIRIYFASGQTVDQLDKKAELLLKELDKLSVPNDEVVNAQHVLGITGRLHPEINKAIEDKRQAIYSAAESAKKVLENALQVIARYEQRINALEVNFNQLTTLRDVSRTSESYWNQLASIIQHKEDLRTAGETLGYFGRNHVQIQRALDNKRQEIYQCGVQRTNALSTAHDAIQSCTQQIRRVPVSFSDVITLGGVDNKVKSLFAQLDAITQNRADVTSAHKTLGLNSLHQNITEAVNEKRAAIEIAATHAKERIKSHLDAQRILVQINFAKHLETMKSLRDRLQETAKTDKHYDKAAQTAVSLYERLQSAEQVFLNSGKPNQSNLQDFQKNCIDAVSDALPVLSDHRGWKQALVNFLSDVLSVLTFGMANLITGQYRFFKTQTQSEIVMQDFSATISGIKVGS
ncbi:hypothetical protein [Legionella bononiensis]|uniref:Ninein n=1 Tax=Legionella bononiensis TaxID=2793102 RepID=A0ABS1WFH1_9GAMM|nr:hypothetical protein [Legionella bononiensis]MBL7481560.1 hypothetical protein [Legionella bononiensis]MBL7528107.1 hypothetical protein [Legionella bononiensis]MBL7562583.1 hypothetical protein [Legionella bononiensis]